MSAAPAPLWFLGSRLILSHAEPQVGDLAVPADDPGLARFLAKLGASISYQQGQRSIIVTSADRRTILFTRGDDRYLVGGTALRAPFIIYDRNGSVFLPFFTIARALDVDPVASNDVTVLQPEIARLETHADGAQTQVFVRAAVPLHPAVTDIRGGEIIRYAGVGTTLEANRTVNEPGLVSIAIATSGPAKNPVTTITFHTAPDAHITFGKPDAPTSSAFIVADRGARGGRKLSQSTPPDVPRSVIDADMGADSSNAPAAEDMPAHAAAPSVAGSVQNSASTTHPGQPLDPTAPTAGTPGVDPNDDLTPAVTGSQAAVSVTSIHTTASPDGYIVTLGVTGTPNYQWHVLSDNRFYIDLTGATMTIPTVDQSANDSRVTAVRMKENGTSEAPNVRLALTLAGNPGVSVSSIPGSVTLTIGGQRSATAMRTGTGRIGIGDSRIADGPTVDPLVQSEDATPWKFGNPQAIGNAPANGSRLIVIDPGHGGSDTGAQHNGLTEKLLTLDIADRMRDILQSRGWVVRMTRTTDVDVYGPNASDRDELQARCDIANRLGARLFVSVHINSFTSDDLNGTTTYYYKPQDAAFASLVQRRLIAALGTRDDGTQHANFYVIHHTTMPAILVETAFLSNPDDAARLRSPAFRESVAHAISDGIGDYSGTARVGRLTSTRMPTADAADDLLP